MPDFGPSWRLMAASISRHRYGYWKAGTVPPGIQIIDLRHKLVDGKFERPLLLVKGREQWCVNKHSTRLYLDQLDKFNHSI